MARDGSAIYFLPGKIYRDVTDLTDTANNYGGSQWGYVEAGLLLRTGRALWEKRAEDHGSKTTIGVHTFGYDPSILLNLVQLDADSSKAAYEGAVDADGDEAAIQLPGSDHKGKDLATYGFRFWYVPDDPEGWVVLMHNAVSFSPEGSEHALGLQRVSTIPLMIRGFEDSTIDSGHAAYPYRQVYWGPREDAVLSPAS